MQPPSVVEVAGCGTLIVSCIATGKPINEFIFRHNDQILSNDQTNVNISITEDRAGNQPIAIAHLTICSVIHENSGNYSCTAQDGLTSDEANFTVNVPTSPGMLKTIVTENNYYYIVIAH